MKKILLPLLLLFSGLASGQIYSIPNFTLPLNHAPNCFLDSSLVFANATLNQRIVYTYDANWRLLKKTNRDWQMNQIAVDTYTYDANDSLIKKTFASGQNVTTSTLMTTMTRNQAKLVAFDTLAYIGVMQNSYLTASSYSYNVSGKIIEIQQSDCYFGSWSITSRRVYTRNSAGKIVNTLFQDRVLNAWQNSTQISYTYNANGDPIDQITEKWMGSSWTNQARWRYAYTGAHVDTFNTYGWSVNTWVNDSRYTYSPAGNLDTVTLDVWNGTKLEGYTRYIRTWSQGLMTSVIEQSFNSSWQNAWKYDYTYDTKGNNIKTKISVPASPWLVLTDVDHYYSCYAIMAGLTEPSNNKAKAYPIPSSGLFFIESEQQAKGGYVFNMNGQTLLRFEGSSVDLSTMLSGIYFVQVNFVDGSSQVLRAIRE